MSPTSREKAYARKRYEKWEQKQAVKQAARRVRRRNTVAAVSAIAAVGLIVGGVMYFTGESGSSTGPTAAITSTATAGATPSASAAASAPDANNPCPEPTAKAGAAKAFDAAPSEADARGKKFTVTVKTTCGQLRMELDGAAAPKAVASFVFLAKKGYFDNTPCHRLTTKGIFVLQCGDPTGTGTGGPGYSYGPVENAPKGDVYPAGTIAMARQGGNGNSMGSQFFLVYKDSTIPSDTAGGYTIMGTVTDGKDVVEKVAAGGVTGGGTDGAPARAVAVTSTKVAQG